MQASVRKSAKRGEESQGFKIFPVIEQQDAQGNVVRVQTPIPFKQLKELKNACSQHGAVTPLTLILEAMATEALPPRDWKQPARACLSGEGYFCYGKQNSMSNVKLQLILIELNISLLLWTY